ncbi:RusA family crossover junction endodeoxyribonuclease [Staphylococcus intermedius]|uniref:RusA family crossover junction endodeoxyribonuclease n=1 Tax=Staphylococcus intermedius TaxID=1285 RepID=UPI000BBC93DB|nr:RusA family crossover junction endodeoxyribonuclease [Staphylococcus intermedius]PCF86370.1 Holliday junction resolvase [Staphylococcus intermedius]
MRETRIEIFYLENDKNLGNPKGSSRPRFSRGGHTYMPAPYVKHKKFVADQLPTLLIDKPIRLTVEFYFKSSKSWSKYKKESHIGQPHSIKPDIDNLLKTILDAGNDKLWTDDVLISEIRTFKKWDSTARTVLIIEELSNDDV